MKSKSVPAAPGQPDPAAKLQEAKDRMKSAADRHAAIVSVLSRVGGSPQEKRLAQAESKKVTREMQDAERSLQEAQAIARKP